MLLQLSLRRQRRFFLRACFVASGRPPCDAARVGDQVDKLKRGWRQLGLLMFLFGMAFGAVSVLMVRAFIAIGVLLMIVCFGVALIGLYLMRLPVYLRRPDEIMRVELYAPGQRDAVQVVMNSGRICYVKAPAGQREALYRALQRRVAEVRVPARVVRR